MKNNNNQHLKHFHFVKCKKTASDISALIIFTAFVHRRNSLRMRKLFIKNIVNSKLNNERKEEK